MVTDWLQRPYKEIQLDSPFEDIVENFFLARGFTTSDAIDDFIKFSLKDLKDPSSLKDMDKAIERLVAAYKNQEAICVYGDFDMDGTPGLALMVRGLRGLGFDHVYYEQADRHEDGYGFHDYLVEKQIKENKISLFVTVDVGITDVAAVEKARELGADVIITDHHQVKDEIPKALAIVNPNQPDCKSGLNYLCGTGVAFYIVMALRRELKEAKVLESKFDIKQLLDCFAIGTIADMVPLVQENRILVKHGLKVLEQTKLVGLRSLMQALNLYGKQLNAQDVGIRFVPKLNSLTRLESEIKPRDLFLVEDEEEAQRMVRHIMDHNSRRVTLLNESEQLLESMVHQAQDRQSLFFWSQEFHKGLVGLLATKLVQKYQKPAFVGAENKDGVIVGSARAPENHSHINVFQALESCQDVLERFGGHPAAAGFEVKAENAQALGEALEDYFKKQGELPAPVTYFDKEVNYSEIKAFMKCWDTLEPFGFEFLPPIFLLQGLKVQKVKELKGGHLKLTFIKEDDVFEAIWFFPEKADLVTSRGENLSMFSILCEPQWNEFMGAKRVQLLIKDLRAEKS